MAGSGDASNGQFRGIAPGAQIINIKVLNDSRLGTDSTTIPALQRVIELKELYNIRVVNLSRERRVAESLTLDPLCRPWKRYGRPA